jgi:hypothetical protein
VTKIMAVVDDALRLCSTFEAEVLLELLLRHWHHPRAADGEFRNDLLESTTEALIAAKSGTVLLEDLRSHETNFIAAVWYVEWSALESGVVESSVNDVQARREWLDAVRHAIPSCFVDPDLLS